MIKFNNMARSTLASDILSTDTTFDLAAGTGDIFPALSGSDYFIGVIVADNGTYEIVKVTNRSADTLTVERGYENTTPTGFTAGTPIENRMTAGTFSDILDYASAAEALPLPEDNKFISAYDAGSGLYALVTADSFMTDLGGTSVGKGVFTAATQGDAQAAMGVVVGSDVAAYDANTAKTDEVNSWNSQQYIGFTSLTDGSNISWDMNNPMAHVVIAGDRTLSAPINSQDGGLYHLIIEQDGTGGRVLSFNAAYNFSGGEVPGLTSDAGAKDMLSCVNHGGTLYCVMYNNIG